MMDGIDWVAALIRLNGREIVGKTRLQKIVYLLETKKLGFGFSYDYHNYGPYSEELAFALDDAESLGFVKTQEKPGHHEVPYTIFSATEAAPSFEENRDLRSMRHALDTMNNCSALVLEVTATAIYLRDNGFPAQFWEETKKRKLLKATPARIEAAKKLIADLQL